MIAEINIDKFDEIFAIMKNSFPEDEFRPYEEQKALFSDKRYKVFGNIEDAGLSSFIATWEFGDFIFIEHFATAKAFRNKGIGEKILSYLFKIFSKPLCLEVEIPEDEITHRRVAFYTRNGFTLNPFSYTQPPISNGKSLVPLMIMTSGGGVSEEGFLSIKKTLYKEVYKINENTTF